MIYKLRITKLAEQDVINASDYIEFVLKNPIAADNLLDEFDSKINDLANFPEKFTLAQDELLVSWGVRFTMVKNYLAIYIIDEETKIVHVVRFLYIKSNWVFILKGGFSLY